MKGAAGRVLKGDAEANPYLRRVWEQESVAALCATAFGEPVESVLGDLIDNLEDDFPGRQYTEGDIYALINDRFCYGVKWVFRSPCRYILQKYMDEVIELIMVEATEREICEQLRFCW